LLNGRYTSNGRIPDKNQAVFGKKWAGWPTLGLNRGHRQWRRADSGGVAVIPAARAEKVLAAATDAAMAQAIEAGTAASDVRGRTYEELTDDRH
jgi:hypothetical protein